MKGRWKRVGRKQSDCRKPTQYLDVTWMHSIIGGRGILPKAARLGVFGVFTSVGKFLPERKAAHASPATRLRNATKLMRVRRMGVDHCM